MFLLSISQNYFTFTSFWLHAQILLMRNVADEKCRKQLATNLQVEFVIRYSNLETQIEDEVAEWLRRQTANLLGSAREGSNPFLVESFLLEKHHFIPEAYFSVLYYFITFCFFFMC